MSNENEATKEGLQVISISKFCPICGAKMNQGMRYGFMCWICPECDFDEPV